MIHESAATRKSASPERRPLPPSTVVRKSNGPETSGARALRQRVGNQGMQRLIGERSGHADGAAPLRSLSIPAKNSEGSSPIVQRKCEACESSAGACAECASEEKRESATPATRVVAAAKEQTRDLKAPEGKHGPLAKEKAIEKKKAGPVECPKETITMDEAKCGRKYGAVATYFYEGAVDWWFKEDVRQGPSDCGSAEIDQMATPIQAHRPYIADDIFDENGPPRKVAPCTDTTFQTVFAGPTEDKVEQCQYKHTQVIEVTATDARSGNVITNAGGGEPAKCAWTGRVSKHK